MEVDERIQRRKREREREREKDWEEIKMSRAHQRDKYAPVGTWTPVQLARATSDSFHEILLRVCNVLSLRSIRDLEFLAVEAAPGLQISS